MKLEISNAKPQEAPEFARLILLSGPRLLPALFGPRVEALLRFLYRRPNNLFSSDHARFARDNRRLIGVTLAIDAQAYSREGIYLASGMLRFFKTGAIPLFFRLLRAHHLMDVPSPGQYYLNNLAVDPVFQGKGIGKALLSDFEQEGVRLGMNEACLDVEVDNPGAQRFYLREGYSLRQQNPPATINRERFQVTRMVKKLSLYERSVMGNQ